MFQCLHVCTLAAYMPTSLHACLFACLHALHVHTLHVCMFACLHAYMLKHVHVDMLTCLHAGRQTDRHPYMRVHMLAYYVEVIFQSYT